MRFGGGSPTQRDLSSLKLQEMVQSAAELRCETGISVIVRNGRYWVRGSYSAETIDGVRRILILLKKRQDNAAHHGRE